jgi:hypothetical protein
MNEKYLCDANQMELAFKMSLTGRLHQILIII